jgi:tetratricopeptide (TPR) repeat protein
VPEPLSALVLLKAAAPELLKIAPWAWKEVPRNSPVGKAIRRTSDRFSTRLPAFDKSLEVWIHSDACQAQVESIEQRSLDDSDVAHVELFLRTTGYGLGISSFEAVSEGLGFFYSELYLALCEGDRGLRFIGAKLEAIHRDLRSVGLPSSSANIGALPYGPPIEGDTTNQAISAEDRRAETELDLIRTLLDKRQGETALRLLAGLQDRIDRGHVSSPIRFRFFVNKGVSHMLSGDWDCAEQEFERARTLEPSNRKALINLAYVANFKGRYEVALAHVASVLAQDPTDANANALRLALLHELGRDQEIQELLNSQPSLVSGGHCLYTLAYIAVDLTKYDEAEHYLQRHNEIDDKYPEAWELLGRTIIIPAQQDLRATAVSTEWLPADKRQRIEEAESCFSRAVQLLATAESRLELACTLGNRGMARSLLGRYDESRQDYESALQNDPSQEMIKANLGRLYLVKERPEDAVHVLERVQSPALKSEIAPILAAGYLDLKKPAAAREVLEALADDEQRGDGLLVKDLLLLSCQRLKDQDACHQILSALDAYTDAPEARRITAEYRAREGEFDEAIRFMRLAIVQAGTHGASRYRLLLGDLLYRANRFAEAADEYEHVPVPAGESGACMRHLMALFGAGRLPKALRLAQTARDGRPAIANFSEVEFLIHERSGDLESADRLRRELLSSGISPVRQKLKIGLNLFRRGLGAEASALVAAVDLASIVNDPELLYDAAMLRTVLGLPGALPFAYQLLQTEPNEADVHLFYVNTFFRREEIDKGLLNPEVISSDCFVTLCHNGQIQLGNG